MSGRRRKSRELALQLLYQNDLAGTPPEEMFARTEEYVLARPEVQEYAQRLVLGTLSRRDELDAKLSERSEHWRLGRMAAVDRNLLRLALYELLFEEDTPDAVVIDEAVEIAKKFSTPSSGPFVNGVLDAIRRATFGPRVPAGRGQRMSRRALLARARLRVRRPGRGAGSAAPPGSGRDTGSKGPRRGGSRAPWRERAIASCSLRRTDASLEARVEVDAAPFTVDAAVPARPRDPLRRRRGRCSPSRSRRIPSSTSLSRRLLADATTTLEAVERVIAFTAHRIRYTLPDGSAETASDTLRTRRGSCVGRSLLAAELLLRAGVPARQVTGILVAAARPGAHARVPRACSTRSSAASATAGSRSSSRASGWVPSDPGGLANTVTARHLALGPAAARGLSRGRRRPFGRAEAARPRDGRGRPDALPAARRSVVEAVEGAPLDPRALAAPAAPLTRAAGSSTLAGSMSSTTPTTKSDEILRIEAKWRERWEADRVAFVDTAKPAGDGTYLLVMLPYPSGDRLHVGTRAPTS